MRIDFITRLPSLADRVTHAFVDREEQGGDDGLGKGASHHAPVVVELADSELP